MAEHAESTGKKQPQGLSSRRLAVEVLISVEQDGAYAGPALNAAFNRKQLSERDRAFVTALVQGVIRHRSSIDEALKALSKQPLQKMPPSLRNLLRMAVFQLTEMSDIPQSAVVNTSTSLARAMGHHGQAKFTNGILRNYLRQKEATVSFEDAEAVSEAAEPAESGHAVGAMEDERLATKYSVPEWLVKRWLQNFGRDETIALLAHAQTTPELCIRVCEQSLTVEALENVFASKGIALRKSELLPSVFIVTSKKHGSPDKLPGYEEGFFTVQDEAAAFVSLVVDPKPGELIVDLCAAPGGKSLHLAELMNNTGRVLAVDKHAGRLNLLKANRTRLGLKNIEIVAADGREFAPDRLAERVLLDAPCTGTGVMNRRSDLRFNREALDMQALTELQKELLANAAKMLKPGGILVYSTCSVEPEENFDNMRWFMREFQEFEPADISQFLPERFKSDWSNQWEGPACKTWAEMTTPCMVQLLPSRHGVSGFFICRLRKKEA